MSYILDALNKAEQTRKQGSDDIQAIPTVDVSNVSQKQNHHLLIILLILSVGVVLFWLSLQSKSQEITSVADNMPTLMNKPVENKRVPPMPAQPQQAETISTHQNTSVLPDTEVESTKPPTVIPTLMNLPQHIRDNLPAINISAHIHGEIAGKRMVIINNKVLHEKDYISEHLRLKTITKQGIELEFDGMPFSMAAMDVWPFE